MQSVLFLWLVRQVHKLTKPADRTCLIRQPDTTPGSNWNIRGVELSDKCSILFSFKFITKYFQYENFFFYLGQIPI